MFAHYLTRTLRRLRRCERGAIAIEFAFAVSALSLLVVGVINGGLAFIEQMTVSNAVRAGTQLALVRHPSLDPNAANDPSIVSLEDIRNAVVEAAPFLQADPGTSQLTVCVFYQCPGGTPTPCLAGAGTPPTCLDRQTLLTIVLDHPYNFLIPFPGFNAGLTLGSTHTIRMS